MTNKQNDAIVHIIERCFKPAPEARAGLALLANGVTSEQVFHLNNISEPMKMKVSNWMRDCELESNNIPQPDGFGGFKFKGFGINVARPSGGKAGKGNNKTSTMRVLSIRKGGCYIEKQFRFRVCDKASYDAAERKCVNWINKNQDKR